jgi:hypothetical protein
MCKENMKIYDAVRAVPKEAIKTIKAGRLQGMSDINPMWRIKVLTEQFGPAGIGWYTETTRTWLDGGEDGVVIANVEIALYIRYNGEWSKPIYGIGGAKFVSKESGGFYTDDDAYKKAYTDAISVACKALGIAADVYWEKDPETKYATKGNDDPDAHTRQPMTFKAAKDIRIVSTDEYNGMTLTEICKVNREYFNKLGNEGTDIVREACAAIVEYIKASKERKNV